MRYDIFVQQRPVLIAEGLIWLAVVLKWGFNYNRRCLWSALRILCSCQNLTLCFRLRCLRLCCRWICRRLFFWVGSLNRRRQIVGVVGSFKGWKVTGAYLDSAACVKLLLANTIFCPVEQQIGVMTSQVQYFCKSQKLMPLLDQSVARQDTFGVEYPATHSDFSSIAALDCSKTCCSGSS